MTSSKNRANSTSRDTALKERAARTCTISFGIKSSNIYISLLWTQSRHEPLNVAYFLYHTAQSFPCKFFHRREKCSQGADCRFSHEPLDDVTNQLLDEVCQCVKAQSTKSLCSLLCFDIKCSYVSRQALKRENELIELSKRAEQETSGPPANADESEMMETNPVPDIFLQPLRCKLKIVIVI